MADILDYELHTILDGFRQGTLSPVDLMNAVLDKAERVNPAVTAFALIDRAGALEAARHSEARWHKRAPSGPLDGVPFTVKDNMIWAGKPTRRGTHTTDDSLATENAPSVDRLLAAGAIAWAKTTLPEFGWKGLGDSPLYGIARNPWDTRVTSGGSSAGAGIAAALGLGPLHLGTDGAGSIRIPASFCGIFGLKPSFGRVPAFPPSPFAIVSHVGPMSRSVADAAAMLGVIAAPDPRDMTALVTPPQDYTAGLELGIRGLKVAWSPRLGYARTLDPEVEALTSAAAHAFAELGAIVEEADPAITDPTGTLDTLWYAGAWSVLRAIPEARWGEVDPGFVRIAQQGRTIGAADFIAAANARGAIYAATEAFFTRYDLLLTPTISIPAFAAGHDTPPGGDFGTDWLSWTPYSYPFNLTLQPAATVPCGLTEAGLPVGLQIVGPMMRDELVLRAARAFETARPWAKIAQPNLRH